jgi:hypothetical protein
MPYVATACIVIKKCKYLLNMDYGDHMKNITLKTNDITNIVHRHYFLT